MTRGRFITFEGGEGTGKSTQSRLLAKRLRGMAIDVREDGMPLSSLEQGALKMRRGGVGYYPQSQFVHLDVGPVRRWS